MKLFKRHMGRRAAGVGVAAALVVLGLAAPAYAVAPTITSVTPSTASDDCEVTLIGTNFVAGTTAVKFGGTAGTGEHVDSSTQMEVTIPSVGDSTSANVVASNGVDSSAPFTFSTGPELACPGVPTFSPSSGIVGSTVTISGTFNSTVTGVRFNTSSLVTPSNPSTTGATAVVPAGATTGPIHVYTAAGQKTSATNFTVTPVPAPTISSFTPTFGPTGTSVKIMGTNFSGTVSGASFTTTGVTFNNVTATFAVNSATQITATVPSTATTGPIKVTTPGGTATSSTNFTVSKTHSRSVTLKLKKHLVAKGVVSVGDGFTACTASVPVKIQRRVSGHWKNVGSTSTSATGSYKKKIKDKPGKYRAKAPKVALNAGVDVCLKATSPVRKNT
jgi:hypothetical protein